MGQRQRYRLLDLERLCWRLASETVEEVGANLEAALQERIAQDQVKREGRWTESLAVGSLSFVERIKPLILSRRETEIVPTGAEMWVLQSWPCLTGKKGARKAALRP